MWGSPLGDPAFIQAHLDTKAAEKRTSLERMHDEGVWTCMCTINSTKEEDVRSCANLPLVLGGVGLRSAARTSVSAYWASWADCLPMMFARHLEVALACSDSPLLAAAASSARVLRHHGV